MHVGQGAGGVATWQTRKKDVNRAAAAPQEEASAAQAAPEAPQPETQDAEKRKKGKHAEGKAHAELAALKTKLEQAEKKLAETKDTLLRTAAEYEKLPEADGKGKAGDLRRRHGGGGESDSPHRRQPGIRGEGRGWRHGGISKGAGADSEPI